MVHPVDHSITHSMMESTALYLFSSIIIAKTLTVIFFHNVWYTNRRTILERRSISIKLET